MNKLDITVGKIVGLGFAQRTVYDWKANKGGKRFAFNLMAELLLLRAKHPKSAKAIQEEVKQEALNSQA